MMLTAEHKAQILNDAMPFIRKLCGKTIVVKYGGNAMTDDALKAGFACDVVLLRQLGINPIVVHGGGPQINDMLARLGKLGEFVQGMRVTDAETMRVVEMVLGGQVNKEIVSLINVHGGQAVGLTGKDGQTIRAHQLAMQDEQGRPVDIGHVGEVAAIEPGVIETLTRGGYIPVIAPIGVGEQGEAFNINADLVAACLAQTLCAEKLILLTNTPGVLDKGGMPMPSLSGAAIQALLADGTLYGGMIPKVQSALDAAHNGVGAVHILDGRVPHALLLTLLTEHPCGTMIHA